MKKLSIGKKSYYASMMFIVLLIVLTYVFSIRYSQSERISITRVFISVFRKSSVISVLVLFLILGGSIATLQKSEIISYGISFITDRYRNRKDMLMAIVMLFFMLMGSLISSYEECIAFSQIIVLLAVSMGWDAITGLYMCLLAESFGFASGITNSFSVGISQGLAGLPVFSGIALRIVAFIILFAVLYFFGKNYSSKIERKEDNNLNSERFEKDRNKTKAIVVFSVLLLTGILLIVFSSKISFLQDRTVEIVTAVFFISSISTVFATEQKIPEVLKTFFKGVKGMLPSCVLFILASSVGIILQQSGTLDLMLEKFTGQITGTAPVSILMFEYLFVICLSFFIPSATAKSFLLIPILVPIFKEAGLSLNLCVLTFALADGLAKALFPTCTTVLLSISSVGVGFITWLKKTIACQITAIVLMAGLIISAYFIGC